MKPLHIVIHQLYHDLKLWDQELFDAVIDAASDMNQLINHVHRFEPILTSRLVICLLHNSDGSTFLSQILVHEKSNA